MQHRPDEHQDLAAPDRRDHIARHVELRGEVSVATLAAEFGVSAVTIRKDLTHLAREHRLLRTRGHALSPATDQRERQFAMRRRQQLREKQAIGAAAASLVGDGQVIALDAGTTALYVARALKAAGPWRHLRVLTNGIPLALELSETPGIDAIVLGGRVRGETLSVVDTLGAMRVMPGHFEWTFVGAAGVTLDDGLIEATAAEAALKRDLITAAAHVVAIVDHTKLGRTAMAPFCGLASIDLLITDSGARPAFLEELRHRKVSVQVTYPASDA